MKQFFFLIAMVLCAALYTNAQSSDTHSSIMFKSHHLSDPGIQASLLTTKTQAPVLSMIDLNLREKPSSNRRYESAKHKRTSGIVLLVIGTTFMASGGTLLAVGGTGIKHDIEYGDSGNGLLGSSFLSHYLELAFGSVFALAGTGMTIPGAILTAKGSRDMRKFKASQTVN